MMKPLRLLVAAAALNVTIGTGVVAAQTVLVRHAKPSETIELDLNATKVATATTDATGAATLPLDLRATDIDCVFNREAVAIAAIILAFLIVWPIAIVVVIAVTWTPIVPVPPWLIRRVHVGK